MPKSEADEFQLIDFEAFNPFDRYKFMTAAVVPRPIALITTLGENGQVNGAPFSQFIILSSTPPILGIVAGRYKDGSKDTHTNIMRSGEFVINTVSEPMAEITQQCAIPLTADQSEIEALGLETRASSRVAPPRLACAQMAFECKLLRTERYGSTATLISGEVIAVQARQGLVDRHYVDHELLKPLGRISGRRYCKTGDILTMGAELDDPFKDRVRPD